MKEIGRQSTLLPPFILAGLHIMRTVHNVLVIKTERFNGMFLLRIAWNISHSSTILQGYHPPGTTLNRNFEINQRGRK